MTIRYLDVCSGYSAFTLGSAGLGFECVGYSEIEAFPRVILEQRHHAVPVDWDHRHNAGSNVVPLFGDFTKIESHHVGPVDLLTGGTPCQAFSVAGKRLGLDDPRGNLTLEFLALAKRVGAGWLAWENVPGFLSHDKGRTMGAFLRILGELGYGWAYRVLDAQYIRVDGAERAVPQRRKRLFVVAHLGDAAGPAAVLFERESLRGDPAPRRDKGEGVAPTISARTKGGGGLGTDFDCDGGLIAAEVAGTLPAGGNVTGGHRQPGMGQETADTMLVAFGGNNTAGPIDVAAALNSHGGPHGGPHGRLDFESETFVGAYRNSGNAGSWDTSDRIDTLTAAHDSAAQHAVVYAIQAGALRENVDSGPDGIGVQEDGAYTLEARSEVQAVAFDTTQITSAANYSNPKTGDPCHPLAAGAHHPAVAYSIMPQNSVKDYKAREVDVAQPLMAGGPVGGNQGGDYIADQWAVRRLTPTECERLMGVPDGFTLITYRGKPAADGPRYKALGNSQARNVMRWIAHGLADVIAIQQQHRDIAA